MCGLFSIDVMLVSFVVSVWDCVLFCTYDRRVPAPGFDHRPQLHILGGTSGQEVGGGGRN